MSSSCRQMESIKVIKDLNLMKIKHKQLLESFTLREVLDKQDIPNGFEYTLVSRLEDLMETKLELKKIKVYMNC